MAKIFFAGVAVIAAGAAAWYLGPQVTKASTAPNFTLYPGGGARPVTLSDLRGKVVVLDFWASWCGPCRAAMPALQRLHEAYRERGVVVLGINVSENGDPYQVAADLGVKYTILPQGDSVAASYNVSGIPTLLVIGKDGAIALRETGWASSHETRMRDTIEAELAK